MSSFGGSPRIDPSARIDPGRVLVVGLDGATWQVLDPWIRDGTLPNLGRLRAAGAWGELESTLPPLTPPAWTSFLTGRNPGKHGVFHFARVDEATADLAAGTPSLVDSRSIAGPTIWDILGHHGRKLVTINVPMSYPPRPVNGVMITCLLTPGDAATFTWPPELSELLPDYRIDLERFIGEKPFARDEDGAKAKRTVEPSLELAEEFREMEEIRGRTALELLRSEPWDAFTVVFTAPDRMGHYLWPYHVPPDAGDPHASALHAAIRGVYQVIDEAIGRLVDAAGEGTHVVVLSDHGMGGTHVKNAHWNTWLYQRGLIVLDEASRRSPDALLLRLGLPRDRIGRLVRRVPMLNRSRAVAKARTSPTAKVDVARSKAYYVRLFDPLGGIRINASGAEREAIRDRLLAELPALVDPETGRSPIRRVLRREDAFEGPYAERMPDVLLLMHPEYGSSDRLSSYTSVVTPRPSVGDPGAHRLEGILMLAGPEIEPGVLPIEGARMVDVAPTILHLLGLPIPDDMDGRVLTEALTSSALEARPPCLGSPLPRWPSDEEADAAADATASGDEERVRERLRDLGYVE